MITKNIKFTAIFLFSLTIFEANSRIAFADAVRFSGGVCESQGNWIQSALDQSSVIISALNTLKDDPNCKALVATLEKLPETQSIESMKSSGEITSGEGVSFASFYRELQAVQQYMNPNSAFDLSGDQIKNMVQYLAFKKTMDVASQLQAAKNYTGLNDQQKAYIDNTSERVASFQKKARLVTEITLRTGQALLNAAPKNQLCFQSRPKESSVIFAALVHTGASLLTGGEVTSLGPFMGSLINFNREMKFMKNISAVEYERYKASVSCILESTQESYCALQDAQDSLDFLKQFNTSDTKSKSKSISALQNPMAGMIVLLRDSPTVSNWFQKVLYGIDPKLRIEAEMKNSNWKTILNYMNDVNSITGTFVEFKQDYINSTQGQGNNVKLALAKKIIDDLSAIIIRGNANINFFTQAVDPSVLPFFLMGQGQKTPQGFSQQTHDFDSFWQEWAGAGEKGLSNPDAIVETIERNMNALIDQANRQSSTYFSQKMVVDPQNLIVQAMSGPNINPYKSIYQIRSYLKSLVKKLEESKEKMKDDPDHELDLKGYSAAIPMLLDTVSRLDRIIAAMEQVAEIKDTKNMAASRDASKLSMEVIYEFANMLVSRDSLLSSRLLTAVQIDVSDTLLRHEKVNENQNEILLSAGKDIIMRLVQYFSSDPVTQRLDIGQATPIVLANLKASEETFAPAIYQAILDINCTLNGGAACYSMQYGPNLAETKSSFSLFPSLHGIDFAPYFTKANSDSEALKNLKAKLCVQSLAFERRQQFKGICAGSKLISEWSNTENTKELDSNYDDILVKIQNTLSSDVESKLTKSKIIGTCALRSYIRKNHIHWMYQSYKKESW